MPTDIYNNFFIQIILFALLATVLLVSVVSLFIKPAKRTIRASLVEAKTGHIIDISQFETSIGRAKTCDIVVSDLSVSRFHAVLSRRANGWLIFDTNSTSGTFVNGGRIKKSQILNDGDHINLGSSEFVFYSTAVTTRQQMTPKIKSTPNSRSTARAPRNTQQKSSKNQTQQARSRTNKRSEQ